MDEDKYVLYQWHAIMNEDKYALYQWHDVQAILKGIKVKYIRNYDQDGTVTPWKRVTEKEACEWFNAGLTHYRHFIKYLTRNEVFEMVL